METQNIFSFYYSKENRIVKYKDQSNNWSLLAAIGIVVLTVTIAAFVV